MSNQEAIARRAYELYLERGSTPGNELEDWLAAEAEIGADTVEATADESADEEREAAPSTPARRKRDAGGASSNRRSLRP